MHDVSQVVNEGGTTTTDLTTYGTVATEALTAEILRGKQHFYDALDPRLSLQSYISCASCHNDADRR